MPQKRPVEKIHAAAFYYSKISSDLQEIADLFEVTTDAVRKWRKTPEWTNALKAFGVEVDELKTTRVALEQREAFEDTKKIYLEHYRELRASGETLRRLPRLVEEQTGIPRRTIYEWAKRYNWRGEETK